MTTTTTTTSVTPGASARLSGSGSGFGRRIASWFAATAMGITIAVTAWPATEAIAAPAKSAVAAELALEPAPKAAASGRGAARAARAPKAPKKELSGKLNLNTATEAQLQMLPGVGPAKAERVVTWRKKNGGFKRVADLRKVKGFGYKSLKKLEAFLDVKGETTLAER